MTKEHLNIIINMATKDGLIEEKEEKIIRAIAKVNELPIEEIDKMIKTPKPIKDMVLSSEDERFTTLYHLIQIMKVDGRIVKSELNFCKEMAEKLGYDKGVVSSLITHIYGNPVVTANRDFLMKKAKKFLKK